MFNYLVGSLSRIFTTLQEVDDKQILYGFVAGFALNCILAAQMLYFWNAPSAKARGKRRQEAPPVAAAAPGASAKTSGASYAAAPKTAGGKGPTTRRRG